MPPADVKLKDPKDFKLIGKRVARKDSVDKTTGKAVFTQDIHLPGMLTAVVAHPPRFGAKVKSFDAAKAKAIGGRAPVKLVWLREDDMRAGYYRPMFHHRLSAGLDDQGRLVGWRHRLVGQSILDGSPFAGAIKDGIDATSVEGASNLPYAIPNMLVDLHTPTDTGVPVLWWRSAGSTHDPKPDDMALLEALKSAAFYVGALGSAVNSQRRRGRLLQHFDLSQAEVDRLHGPVGLPIGSRTPPEIAVAVLAEMIAVRNRAGGMDWRRCGRTCPGWPRRRTRAGRDARHRWCPPGRRCRQPVRWRQADVSAA